MLIQKIVQELQDIPEDKLAELYDLISFSKIPNLIQQQNTAQT
ncbi:hypothetical protein [Nostoc sp.]